MSYTYPKREKVLKLRLTNQGLEICGAKCSVVAKELLKMNSYIFATIENSDKGFIYIYDKSGVYKLIQEREIHKIIKDFLEHYSEAVVSKSNIKEVYDLMITDMCSVNINEFNSNPKIINFMNGILNIDTLQLTPHDSSYLFNIQMPVNWNANFVENPELALSPVFDKYLDTLTKGYSTKDAEDIKTVLLEVMGVVLSNVPGYKFKKALLVFGEGNTGKTQIRNLAISLIGEKNSAVVELADLETREGPSRAYGKRLIGSGDMKYGTAGQIATFKDVTGGETLPVRFLYKEAFSAKINGVFWFGANFLPLFGGDKGKWVYERFIPIRCKNVIPEEERDPDLLDKMLIEKEAIVFKAVMAMREAVKRGYKYTIPESAKKDLEVYKTENNIIIEFFNEHCIKLMPMPGEDWKPIDTKSDYTKAQIFNSFSNWAKENYKCYPSRKDFETTISEILGIPVEELSTRTACKRVYNGFDITEECFNAYCRLY